jgi:hypothetical protein
MRAHTYPRSPASAAAFLASKPATWVILGVCAVVVEEVALNVCLAGLIEKIKFIGPEIRVIAFPVGIVPHMARAGRRERQEICARCTFIGSAIRPERPLRLPIRPQAFVCAPQRPGR